MHTVESLCAQFGALTTEGQLVLTNALALFDAAHAANVRALSPRDRELLQAAAPLSQLRPTDGVLDALAHSPLDGFSADETAAIAAIVNNANNVNRLSITPNDSSGPHDIAPLCALLSLALAINTSTVERVVFTPVDDVWASQVFLRGPLSHTDAIVAQERTDMWRDTFGPIEIFGRIDALDIDNDDTLAAAGQISMRYRYDALGGRDAWTLVSPNDVSWERAETLHNAVRALRSDARLFERGFRGKFIRKFDKHARALDAALRRVRAGDARLTALNTYTELCDEDARTGLQPLAKALRAKCDTQRVKLIALVNGDAHQDWLDALDSLTLTGQMEALSRDAEPGERSHVRHIAHAAIANRRSAIKAYDTLPDAPNAKQLRALSGAISRLQHVVEALSSVLPADEVSSTLEACAAAQSAFNAICDAHDAASHALQLAAQRATNKSAITFADAQHKVIQARLPSWRVFLQPFL